jgi:biopolymer transport protein ExbB
MIETLIQGGPLMIPLVLCSLAAIAVVFDRWTAFRHNARVDVKSLRAKVLAHLQKGSISAAIEDCEASRGPVAAVLLAGLKSYSHLKAKGENAETMRMVVGEVMQDASAHAMSSVNSRLDVLTTVGTAAPLLGMTGTVTGMIGSFAGLAEAGSSGGGGGKVAMGIAEALITTAAGLLIALAAVIPQSLFNRWSDEIELEIDEAAGELVEHILTSH